MMKPAVGTAALTALLSATSAGLAADATVPAAAACFAPSVLAAQAADVCRCAERQAAELRQPQGYDFATVSELLAMGTPEVAQSCYGDRLGDTQIYDRPWRKIFFGQ